MSISVFGRGIVGDSAMGAWIVLLAGLPIGVDSYLGLYRPSLSPLGWSPGGMAGLNFHTYFVAAKAAQTGGDLYGVFPPDWSAAYTYQYLPVTVVTFYPFTVADWWTGYLVFLGVMVVVSGIATWMLVRYIEMLGKQGGWVDYGLIFVFVLFSTHTMASVYFGNVNLLLAVGIVFGFVALARGHEAWAGVGFGVVAVFKVFPALIGVWLLRIRAWRAVIAALGTGIGAILLGIGLYGVGTTREFFTAVLVGRTGSSAFVGGYPPDGLYYVTVQRPFSHFIWMANPEANPVWLGVVSVLVCGAVLAYFYVAIPTGMDRLIAMFVTITVAIVMFPSYRLYLVLLYFPLIPLLYVWDGPGLGVFVAGGVLLSVTLGPADVIGLTTGLPDFLATVITALATVATVQLYALTLMVAGCALHKRSRGVGGVQQLREILHESFGDG